MAKNQSKRVAKKKGGGKPMFKDWLTKERLLSMGLVLLVVLSLWFSIRARSTVNSEIEESSRTLATATATWESNIDGLERQIDAIETSIITLREDLGNTESSLASGLATSNSQLASLTNTLAGVKSTVDGISIDTQMIADTRSDLDDLEDELNKLEKKVKKLEDFYGEEERVAYYTTRNGFNEDNPTWFPMMSSAWVGQQFTVDEVTYVRSIKLYLKLVEGSPTTVSVRLYDTNNSGLPTGSPWFKETFNPSLWTKNEPRWYEFEVANYRIDPDEIYVLVLEDNDGNDENLIGWGYDHESGEYDDGKWVKSYDGGDTWAVVDDGNSDGSFEIWGGVR